jgi:quercetin dioxygenase-like cupin family protein
MHQAEPANPKNTRNFHRVFDESGYTFEPGARTAWHTHPLGQALIVTSGL